MTTLNQPRLIVFDWDGTLAQSTDRIVTAFLNAIGDLPLPARQPEDIRGIIGLGLPEAIAALFPDTEDTLRRQLADAYRDHYFNDASRLEPYAGAEQLLQDLNAAGCWLAIATGKSRRGLNEALAQTGLGAYFLGTRTADETASKPAPLMLHSLFDEFGVMPQEAWMIGDTDFDLLMGHNAGCAPVAITHGAHDRSRLERARPAAWLSDLASLMPLYHAANPMPEPIG